MSTPTAVLQREGTKIHTFILSAVSWLYVVVFGGYITGKDIPSLNGSTGNVLLVVIMTTLSLFLLLPSQEIDDYIVQAKERSYETMVNFGKQGLSIAATAAVTAAVKASMCVGVCMWVVVPPRCCVSGADSVLVTYCYADRGAPSQNVVHHSKQGQQLTSMWKSKYLRATTKHELLHIYF